MAIKGASGCPDQTKNPINICSVQSESFLSGLGAAVDPAGYFCRWSGVKPYPLRLSADSHHGVLFWRQKRPGQTETDRTRYLLHRGTGADQLVAGCFAALTGGLIGALLQSPLVLIAIAVVLAAFAMSLFGFWELRLPFRLTQAAAKSYTGFFGSFFMGITLGVVAAPCIGPFVLGLLTWVATLADPLMGFVIFFTLSLGLGTPLFGLAIFSGQLEKLPKSGEWMNWVRRLMGWVLIGMAAYFVRPDYTVDPCSNTSLPPLPLQPVFIWAGWIKPQPFFVRFPGSKPSSVLFVW